MKYMRGQGSTEYLVLLAVALIVALVAIALLGRFPGVSADTRESQSRTYWSSAQPFSIVDYKIDGTDVELVLLNTRSQRLTLNEVSFGNEDLNISSTVFPGGAQKTVTGTLNVSCGSTGDLFEYEPIGFLYNSPGISDIVQAGAKPLLGRCS